MTSSFKQFKEICCFTDVVIFTLIFKFIFALILGFMIINPSYIPFLIGLKISFKSIPKSFLLDKNKAKMVLKMIQKWYFDRGVSHLAFF